MGKNMFTRAISVILIVTLLLMLVGCSGTSSSTPASTAPSTSTPAPASVPASAPTIDYPTKSIEITIGFGAGGDTDLFARAMAENISKELGVSVIVNNVTGAGGSIASNAVKEAKTDGYTVLFCHNSLIGNYVCDVTDYSHEEFEVACLVARNDSIYLALNPSKYPTVEDYIEYCKANPNQTTFGAIFGGSYHPMTLGVIDDLGIETTLVDIGSSSTGNIEVAAGRIDAFITNLASSKAYFESGELYPAIVFSEERKSEYPDVQTLKERGGASVCEMFYGFYFPKGTDEAIIEIFNEAAEKASKNAGFAELTATYGANPLYVGYGDALPYMDEIQDWYLRYQSMLS